jgi:tRNA uridine 5-carboxymethylaminomethyl modification enzyme
MYTFPTKYDVIVIGGGHAGCEAALATARLGCSTLLLSINLDTIAQMSCNPAIGGLAKGHLVREIDALGGEMAKIIDRTAIHFRMLNTRKGPAVWAPRAQADKKAYQFAYKQVIEQQSNLDVKQELVTGIATSENSVEGVITANGITYRSRSVILCSGTFLNGLIHIGDTSYESGRAGEFPSVKLSQSLEKIGFKLGRLKTGTPPRINANSIDLSRIAEIQHGDPAPFCFSYSNDPATFSGRLEQIPCYITFSTEKTGEIIRANIDRSPLFSGKIKGTGPRYCPSIEDKIVRFPHRRRHQIFLEPEGLNTGEVYVNGCATSLPYDVQIEVLHSIEGLESAQMMRPGYAVEYDFAPPDQIDFSLETRLVQNLFFAGQINGTSGYEEAGAQGLIAGINCVKKLKGEGPIILERSDAYIGVLIDDLVLKGTKEPYRMFTSRAEYRLLLRQDNADLRLMETGHRAGLISDEKFQLLRAKKEKIESSIKLLNKTYTSNNTTLAGLLRRPEMTFQKLNEEYPKKIERPGPEVERQVELEIKYEGYIRRQRENVEKFQRMEHILIPESIDFSKVPGLRNEAIEKLTAIKPKSLGQALRISGISPADISVLMVQISRDKRGPSNATGPRRQQHLP